MSLSDISLHLPEDEYRALPALSYSMLERYDREGYGSIQEGQEATSSMTFGSLLDCRMFYGQEKTDSMYVTCDAPPVSDTLMSVIRELADSHPGMQMAMLGDDDILEVTGRYRYYPNYRESTRISKVRTEGAAWLNALALHPGAVPISREDYADIQEMADRLEQEAGWLFHGSDRLEVLHQEQYMFQLLPGIQVKGMPDIIAVDHDSRTVSLYDLKTVFDVYQFETNFYKYRYYLQASVYTELLKEALTRAGMEGYVPDLWFRYIAIDRDRKKPVMFRWRVTDIVRDRYGELRKDWRTLAMALNEDLLNRNREMPCSWYEETRDCGAVTLKNYADENKGKAS